MLGQDPLMCKATAPEGKTDLSEGFAAPNWMKADALLLASIYLLTVTLKRQMRDAGLTRVIVPFWKEIRVVKG